MSALYHTGQLRSMEIETARTQLYRDVHPALAALARAETQRLGRNERLLLLCVADSDLTYLQGPCSAFELTQDRMVSLLARLGTACGHPTRTRLLQTLYQREECLTAELAEASGTSGGNLYQHLNELLRLELISQSARGRFSLTEPGRLIVTLLFWCATKLDDIDQLSHVFERKGQAPHAS